MKNPTSNSKNNFRSGLPIAYCMLSVAYCLLPSGVSAQRDTTRKGTTIDINSSFKPELRTPIKINLSASPLNADSTKPSFKYDIPAQNLFYTYDPASVIPVELAQDSSTNLGSRNFAKLGIGNYATLYGSAGVSLGDGKKKLLNVYADYTSSKGKIKYQQYAQLNVKAAGSYFLQKNEIYGGAEFKRKNFNLYGYDQKQYSYSKSDVRQQFMDITTYAGVRNTVVGEYGISYNPMLSISHFISRAHLAETTIALNAPMEKRFGEVFKLKVAANADLTFYNTMNLASGNVRFSNNVVSVAPALNYSTPKLTINGGITPTWDNGKFVWLPDVYAQAQIRNIPVIFQAGWVGRVTKNTYRNLSAINPYLETLTEQKNTTETEYYGGIKASFLKHFNVNAKLGVVHYNDYPFFINDTTNDGKSFVISNESRVNNLRLHGDISYINQEKFTATAGVTFNGYTFMKDNAKAWNTIPMELNASVRWWAFKQILLKADFYAFGGGHYLLKGNTSEVFPPGSDLSAGAEFRISKRFSAWLDVNNILNNKYQRWHNYEVYGLNLVGGVKVNF